MNLQIKTLSRKCPAAFLCGAFPPLFTAAAKRTVSKARFLFQLCGDFFFVELVKPELVADKHCDYRADCCL